MHVSFLKSALKVLILQGSYIRMRYQNWFDTSTENFAIPLLVTQIKSKFTSIIAKIVFRNYFL